MVRLRTVLGKDVLVLLRFEGQDYLNRLSEYQGDCLVISPDIDFDSLIGTHASVVLATHDGEDRPFSGLITEARWLGPGENGHRYRLSLKPWFWLARLRRNQRIFHNKTVVQTLQDVLESYASGGAVKLGLVEDYPELESTVQYRESDFAFACRLMERFGLSWHFTHTEDAHVLVLTDAVESHGSIGARPYKPADGHHQEEVEHFRDWRLARRLGTGAIRLTDYNFNNPVAAMEVDRMGDAVFAHGQIESFDYPGDYPDQRRGRVVAGLRTEGERGQGRRFEASGDIPTLGGGMRVTLSGDAVPGRGEEFICLSALHSYVSDSYGTGGSVSDGYSYTGAWVLMPSTAPLRPELKTRPALVHGPQTAMVVGAGEIDCDEFGRILVRFHWDLEDALSMRCRVSQNWAGNGWGGMVIPRIGMEVVVEFLEGDPDKPLVTGCVYNGKNAVPYALPQHKTRSTFRTDTHQGKGFNELRFEDAKGNEEIFMHAQKDMNIEVLNDRAKEVGNNQMEMVGNDKSIEVKGDHDELVCGNMSVAVGQNPLSDLLCNKSKLVFDKLGSAMKKMKIPDPFNFGKGNYQLFVEKCRSEVIGVGSSEIVGAAKSVIVGHSYKTTVGKSHSLIVRGRADADIGKVHNIRIGDRLTIKVGEKSVFTMSK